MEARMKNPAMILPDAMKGATTNFFNRINTTIREQAGATWN